MMADHIVSVDSGNGGTNAVLAKESGKTKTHFVPSVRAMATGDSLGIAAFELDYAYVDWYGYRYVVGDDASRVTKRALERHMGHNRYGEEFHRFMVATALAGLGVKSGSVALTTFAPPGMFREARPAIESGFLDNPTVCIQLKGERKPREWTYESVDVWPEGIGAAACFMLDEEGQRVDSDLFKGETMVIDIGAYTLDVLQFSNGSFNVDRLADATIEQGGVNTHIREPILRMIHKRGDDFTTVTLDDLDIVLRQGLSTGEYILSVAGYDLDLKAAFEKYFMRYGDWISNNVIDASFNGFRGIKSVILVGGGAVMVEDRLKDLYPDKILDRKKHPTTKKIHPVDFNAVGGLRLALSQG